jgi:hypothetical protein
LKNRRKRENMYEIKDNFINVIDFEQLEDYIMPHGHTTRPRNEQVQLNNVPWFFRRGDSVEETESEERLKGVTKYEKLEPYEDKLFQHLFLLKAYQSNYIQAIMPLLASIDPLAFCRIVANLTLPQKENKRSLFHVDGDKEENPSSESMTTSIFYMNTTNGPTLLEDGTEIECRANRLVTYSNETQHAAVLCTDQPYRVVINLNYFK